MAKSFAVVALIISAFCFSSALATRRAPSDEKFSVLGKIYCDPCHFEFETKLSHPLEGIKVTLECRKADSDIATYVKEARTDKSGYYSIPVDGDHEDEICSVNAEAGGKDQCTEPMANKSDRIVLTDNMGVSSFVRFVNPLGFMTKAIDSQCATIVKELGLDRLDD